MLNSDFENTIEEKYNEFFGMEPTKKENSYVLMEYTDIFNAKFRDIGNNFKITDYTNIYNFIKNHEDIFELLERIKLILPKYFKNQDYILKLRENPEDDNVKLNLIIKIDYSIEGADNITKKLIKINSEIRPLKRKLNLINSFFIDVECL